MPKATYLLLLLLAASAPAQRINRPRPSNPPRVAIAIDAAAPTPATADQPLPPMASMHNAYGIHSGTLIRVRITQQFSSATAHNGDIIPATLAAPIGALSAGTPVTLTVVAVAAAGSIHSWGELSLQVVSINGQHVLTDVVTLQGQEGKKDLADSAPAKGTDATTPRDPIALPAA